MPKALEEFLAAQPCIQEMGRLYYAFVYKDIPCGGYLSVFAGIWTLRIYPAWSEHDIGFGKGNPEVMTFMPDEESVVTHYKSPTQPQEV